MCVWNGRCLCQTGESDAGALVDGPSIHERMVEHMHQHLKFVQLSPPSRPQLRWWKAYTLVRNPQLQRGVHATTDLTSGVPKQSQNPGFLSASSNNPDPENGFSTVSSNPLFLVPGTHYEDSVVDIAQSEYATQGIDYGSDISSLEGDTYRYPDVEVLAPFATHDFSVEEDGTALVLNMQPQGLDPATDDNNVLLVTTVSTPRVVYE